MDARVPYTIAKALFHAKHCTNWRFKSAQLIVEAIFGHAGTGARPLAKSAKKAALKKTGGV